MRLLPSTWVASEPEIAMRLPIFPPATSAAAPSSPTSLTAPLLPYFLALSHAQLFQSARLISQLVSIPTAHSSLRARLFVPSASPSIRSILAAQIGRCITELITRILQRSAPRQQRNGDILRGEVTLLKCQHEASCSRNPKLSARRRANNLYRARRLPHDVIRTRQHN